jgi:hypothetical protein
VKIEDYSYLTCGGCMNRVYCCKEHQKVDWGLHKHACKYNLDSCEVCGTGDHLQSCAGCLRRKFCCVEHQKQAWKDHKPLCLLYQRMRLSSQANPSETALSLLKIAGDLEFGPEMRVDLALRANIEALALTKHFGLTDLHFACLLHTSGSLVGMERWEEAEAFARDTVNFAKVEMHGDRESMMTATTVLVGALSRASKAKEKIEICDHFLALFGSEDSSETNQFRMHKSQALSLLERNEEALKQLDFVPTTKFDIEYNWVVLSHAQMRLGRLSEATKSMETAVAFARTGEEQATPVEGIQSLAKVCKMLAGLYEEGGRFKDARRLAKEAEALRTSLLGI